MTTLFIHSTGTGPGMWASVPEDLAPGRSMPPNVGYPPDGPVPRGQIVTLEDDLARLLESAEGPVDIVAHSYGATLALALLGKADVRSLVLVEPVLFGALVHTELTPDIIEDTRWFLEERWFLDDLERGGTEAWLIRFVDYWNRPGSFAAMPAVMRETQLALGWKMFQEVRACFYGMDHFPEIPPEIRTTLAFGERTTASSKAMIAEMARRSPHAVVVALPGTGHMAPVTHPGKVHTALREHIQRS